MKKYVIAILVSNLKFFERILRFFPKEKMKNTDISIVYDNRFNESKENEIDVLFRKYNNFNFEEYWFTTSKVLIDYYGDYLKLKTMNILNNNLAIIKLLMKDFYVNGFYQKAFILDDDLFITKNLEELLKLDEDFLIYKDCFNKIQKREMLDNFNKVFKMNLSFEDISRYCNNSGTTVVSYDNHYLKYLKDFLENDYFNFLTSNKEVYGYRTLAWLLDQLMWQFHNYHLFNTHKKVGVINSYVRLLYMRAKAMNFLKDDMKINKYIYHYACGKSKEFFLKRFSQILTLQGYKNEEIINA